jgi:hypothetical protein
MECKTYYLAHEKFMGTTNTQADYSFMDREKAISFGRTYGYTIIQYSDDGQNTTIYEDED